MPNTNPISWKSIQVSLLVMLGLFCGTRHGYAQQPYMQASIFGGLQMSWYLGKNNSYKESGSHFTFGVAVGASFRREQLPVFFHLQSGVNLYASGLGTNLLNTYISVDTITKIRVEHRRRWELDMVNTALINLEFGGQIAAHEQYLFPIKHFNHITPNLNYIHRNMTVTYGVNYIFNSSQRNQDIAFLGISSPWLSLGMYNDGAVPFFLGDQYDRFWSGGGYVRVSPLYNLIEKTPEWNELSLEYNFNRFTYDVQDGYRLAHLLMIPIVQDASFYNLLYNNSLMTFKVNWRNASVGMSVMGKMKGDVQDFIHNTLGLPRHITFKQREVLAHVSYFPMIKLK